MNSPSIPRPVAGTSLLPERFLFGGSFALLLLAVALAGGTLESELLLTTYGGENGRFLGFWRVLSGFGSNSILAAVIVVATVFLIMGRRHFEALWLSAGWGATTLAVELLKWLVDRDRPPLQFLTPVRGSSFPSGHAAESLFVYLYLWLILARLRSRSAVAARLKDACSAVLSALPLLIGYSRVYLGVHWPGDVLGGWAIGLFILGVAFLASP
jgi:membrane-associated phospholipid phosphatase